MNEAKQVAAEEGARLQGAPAEQDRGESTPASHPAGETPGRWLRVEVSDLGSGRRKVNVNIPLGMVEFGLRMGARFAPAEFAGLDLEQIMAALKAGETGQLVDVEDEEKGQRVVVSIG